MVRQHNVFFLLQFCVFVDMIKHFIFKIKICSKNNSEEWFYVMLLREYLSFTSVKDIIICNRNLLYINLLLILLLLLLCIKHKYFSANICKFCVLKEHFLLLRKITFIYSVRLKYWFFNGVLNSESKTGKRRKNYLEVI